jgi:hypothetical protein
MSSIIHYKEFEQLSGGTPMGTLTCSIALFTQYAYMIYTFTETREHLFEYVKNKIRYLPDADYDNDIEVTIPKSKALLFNGRDSSNRCYVIESKIDDFSAVIFPLTAIRESDAAKYSWEYYTHCLGDLTYTLSRKDFWQTNDYASANIEIIKDTESIALETSELAASYRNSYVWDGDFVDSWQKDESYEQLNETHKMIVSGWHDANKSDMNDGVQRGLFSPLTTMNLRLIFDHYRNKSNSSHLDAIEDLLRIMELLQEGKQEESEFVLLTNKHQNPFDDALNSLLQISDAQENPFSAMLIAYLLAFKEADDLAVEMLDRVWNMELPDEIWKQCVMFPVAWVHLALVLKIPCPVYSNNDNIDHCDDFVTIAAKLQVLDANQAIQIFLNNISKVSSKISDAYRSFMHIDYKIQNLLAEKDIVNAIINIEDEIFVLLKEDKDNFVNDLDFLVLLSSILCVCHQQDDMSSVEDMLNNRIMPYRDQILGYACLLLITPLYLCDLCNFRQRVVTRTNELKAQGELA